MFARFGLMLIYNVVGIIYRPLDGPCDADRRAGGLATAASIPGPLPHGGASSGRMPHRRNRMVILPFF
jgi:hypothetical protein